MSKLIAPQVVSENVLYEKYGKVVVEKTFLLPNGETIEYLLWGGAIVPSIIRSEEHTSELQSQR